MYHSETDDALVLPWRKFSVGLGLVLVATLVTLVVVVTVRDVEVLSTVALALAVLAFGAQLVTSLIQGQAAGDQQAQAERINTETRALLASIDAATTGLRGTVERQFDSLLTHVVSSAVPDALSAAPPGSSAEEIQDAILSELRSEMQAYLPSQPRPPLRHMRLRPGDIVEHPKFGRGYVRAVEGKGDKAEASIRFGEENTKEKRLLVSWSPLEVVGRQRPVPPESRPSLFDDNADDNSDKL